MPRGPKGEKRPADVIGNAVKVMRIATGEIDDPKIDLKKIRSISGAKGGKTRAHTVPADRRTKIAKTAAQARWARKKTTVLTD